MWAFHFVQCLIQRAPFYASSDVRQCYMLVKKALYRRGVKKVILILHSQSGIEGGIILDWLLDEVPQDLLQCLEVYIFSCLENHVNNPCRSTVPSAAIIGFPNARWWHIWTSTSALSHIYANAYNFATRWGVLNFTKMRPKDSLETFS